MALFLGCFGAASGGRPPTGQTGGLTVCVCASTTRCREFKRVCVCVLSRACACMRVFIVFDPLACTFWQPAATRCVSLARSAPHRSAQVQGSVDGIVPYYQPQPDALSPMRR